METKGFEHGTATALTDQNGIRQGLEQLLLEVERLHGLRSTPEADDSDLAEEADNGHSDQPQARNPAESRPAPRRRRLRLILLGVVAASLSVGGLTLWNYLQSYESTDDAQVDGYLDPISSRINGTITKVYVDNNQRVTAGQPLVELDPRDYQMAVEQARAQLAQANADLNSARQQYVSAIATVGQAQAQNYLAQRNQQRYAELIKFRVVSQAEFDQYDATARSDAATVKVDEAAAASAQRTIGSREAQVQQDQAALDQAELNLSYTRITAPAKGIIGNRSAQLGQRVQPGQSLMALTQMNDASDLWVTADFKETQLARMGRGQAAIIHVDALRRDFKGHVLSMPGATGSLYELLPPENATGNYVKIVQRLPVRITFDPGQDLRHLRPGMSVEPTVWLR
jgi:membrane fusion protein, multidrug efflux system